LAAHNSSSRQAHVLFLAGVAFANAEGIVLERHVHLGVMLPAYRALIDWAGEPGKEVLQ
jgi:hypothetical protein